MERIALSKRLFLSFIVAGILGSNGIAQAALNSASTGFLAGSPSLKITKSCPSLRYVGRDATFEITVSNTGDGPAFDVVVTDRISGSIQFVSADNDAKRQGDSIVWRLGTVEAGKSRTLKSTFRCGQIGKIRNTATVTYCAESVDECELEVRGIPAILLEVIDLDDPIEIGGKEVYEIMVTNQGSAVGTNIVIDCVLPAQQEYVSSDGPTTASVSGKRITFAPLPSLAPKAKTTYRITSKGIGTGDTRFKVVMTSDQLTSPVEETESTHIYE